MTQPTDAPDPILARLRKIRALAEHGIDGEREAAQLQLERLLREHDITLAELASDQAKEYSIAYRGTDERRLVAQVAAQVIDSRAPRVAYTAKLVFITCTAAQWADIKDRYAHYLRELRAAKRDLKKRERLLLSAMIQKHGIFPASDDGSERPEMTEERRRELVDLYYAMQSLRTADFTKPAPRLEHAQP